MKYKMRTFDHLSGREGIRGPFQVTGRVIEYEEALCMVICLAFKDVNHSINLRDELIRIEVSIAVLAQCKHNTGLSAE